MKCDLHRHAGGSISPSVVTSILKRQGNNVDLEDVSRSMQFSEEEDYGFKAFLDKFNILYEIKWDEKVIALCIEQIVWDLASDLVSYAEIHFSIDKYLNHLSWTPSEAVDFITRRFSVESEKWDIIVAPILSLRYDSDREQQLKIAKVVSNPNLAGIDLVGDESFFDHDFYKPILDEWKEAGKGIIAHVGESQTAENVRAAILLGVDRIAHGIRSVDYPDIMKLAQDHNVCFDIALSSNIVTGVVSPDLSKHPIHKMVEAGCSVTIGTDDPIQCNTNIDNEYSLLADSGMGDNIEEIWDNSVKYAFRLDKNNT